jgi:hypothetical protein
VLLSGKYEETADYFESRTISYMISPIKGNQTINMPINYLTQQLTEYTFDDPGSYQYPRELIKWGSDDDTGSTTRVYSIIQDPAGNARVVDNKIFLDHAGTSIIRIEKPATDELNYAYNNVTLTIVKGIQFITPYVISDNILNYVPLKVVYDGNIINMGFKSSTNEFKFETKLSDPRTAANVEFIHANGNHNGNIIVTKVGTIYGTALSVGNADFDEKQYNDGNPFTLLQILPGNQTITTTPATPYTLYYSKNPIFTIQSDSIGTGTFKYISDNTSVADVENNTDFMYGYIGNVTLNGIGNTTIRITRNADDLYNEATTMFDLTVLKGNQTIGLEKYDATGNSIPINEIDGEPRLEMPFYYQNYTFTIKASSEVDTKFSIGNITNRNCASADTIYETTYNEITRLYENKISFRMYALGYTYVTIEKIGDDYYTSSSRTLYITIGKGDQTFDIPDILYPKLTDAYLTLIPGGIGNGTITYSQTDGYEYALLDKATGNVTLKLVGNATIKIYKGDTPEYSNASKTVTISVLQGDNIITVDNAIDNVINTSYDNTPYKLTPNTISTKKEFKYEIVNLQTLTAGNGTVSNDGNVTVNECGEIGVKVSNDGDTNYQAGNVVITLNVAKIDQQMSFGAYNGLFTYSPGLTFQLNPIAPGTGAFKYRIGNTQIATISSVVNGNATVNIYRVGNTTITATKEPDANYNETTKELMLSVSQSDQTITVNEYPNPFVYKPPLSFTIIPFAPGTGAFEYTIGNTQIANISSVVNGNVTMDINKPGNTTITIRKNEDINYRRCSCTFYWIFNCLSENRCT